MSLGSKLKASREGKGYTLKQTAEISGLSIGFISQVERGQADPSISSLKKLAAALNVKLGELFDQSVAEHILVKRGEGRLLQIDSMVYCELLATFVSKTMEPMVKVIQPNGTSGVVDPHAGEEFIWIIEGTLKVRIGDTTYIMRHGDSIYFQANQPHAWKNIGEGICRALWVMTPPSYS